MPRTVKQLGLESRAINFGQLEKVVTCGGPEPHGLLPGFCESILHGGLPWSEGRAYTLSIPGVSWVCRKYGTENSHGIVANYPHFRIFVVVQL